jgi:hypothetical protein
MGVLFLAVGVPLAVRWAFLVRRDGALMRDAYLYAGFCALVASGIGWVSGFGAVGFIFAPFGAIVGLLDALFHIGDLVVEWLR